MIPIIKTKLRSKLLTYYFMHPDESYYVREIASLIIEDPGNLSRELRSLENDGVFKSSFKGRVKLYSLNKDHPIFNELKNIIFKTEGVEGGLRKLVAGYRGVKFAFIYGSYAKNKENKTSDIDMAVVGSLPRDEFTRKVRNLESISGKEINFTIYAPEDFEKQRNKEGGFLNIVLNDKIIILKGVLNAG